MVKTCKVSECVEEVELHKDVTSCTTGVAAGVSSDEC